jgi:hypothetical protein
MNPFKPSKKDPHSWSNRQNSAPVWLRMLERTAGWIAIPNLGILLVTLQALGFIFISMDPAWAEVLALIPSAVRGGEYWRLVTFLSMPLSQSPLWMIFVLWFLYFIVNTLEQQWGAMRTTLYVIVSVALTIAYSLALDYPVLSVSHFESSLFLAAAMLFPEFEVSVFFLLPVQMKWLAALSGLMVLIEAWQGTWYDRGYLLAIYSNFIVFFGPAGLGLLKQSLRRWRR